MTFYKKTGIKTIPKKKEMQKSKIAVWGGLEYLWKEEKQKAKEERKDVPIWMQCSKE